GAGELLLWRGRTGTRDALSALQSYYCTAAILLVFHQVAATCDHLDPGDSSDGGGNHRGRPSSARSNDMFGLSIRSLLIGLFAMLAVIFAAQGLLSISKISAVNASAVDLADNWLAKIKAVKQINVTVARLRINQARHMVATSDDEMTAIERDREARIKELAAERKAYEPLMTTEEERRTFAHFADTWEKFQKIHLALYSASRAHRNDEVAALFRSDAHTMFRDMNAALDKLVAISENGAAEAVHQAAASHATALWVSYVALGFGVMIALGAIAFSFWARAHPIGDLTGSMSELAAGNMEASIPFAARRDEIGRMAAAVQVFRDNMIKARRLEAEATAAQDENERRRKADMHRLAKEFEAAVGGIIAAVSSSATELEASAGTLTKTAEVTQQRSGSAAAASDEASANVRSVAAATEEITSSVNE